MVERQDLTVYTVGHSTRSMDEFIELLKTYNITMLVDIRATPRSYHNPQFNKEALFDILKLYNIKYLSMSGIGGMRHPKKDSINLALGNNSFRGYADFMQTKEFVENLLKLVVLAKENCLAIMCAEALPGHCHRNLISDVLVVRHIQVLHIISRNSVIRHQLNDLAYVEDTKVSYPLFSPKETPQRTLRDFRTT